MRDGRNCDIPLISDHQNLDNESAKNSRYLYYFINSLKDTTQIHAIQQSAMVVKLTIPKDRSGRFSGQKVPNCDNNLSKELE